MPKSYVFTARRQIDDFLKEYNSLWFNLSEIKRVLEQKGKGYSISTIRRSLQKSGFYRSLAKQRVDGVFYYRSRYGEYGVGGNRFIPPCTCYIAAVVGGHGYMGGEDDCSVHGMDLSHGI